MKKLKQTTHAVPERDADTNTHPRNERIRQRAYEIHKARGGGSGRELDDWLQAERELLAQLEHPADSSGHTGHRWPQRKSPTRLPELS